LLARARTPASLAGQPARSLATLRQPASGTGNPQQPGSGLGPLRRAGDSGSGLGPLGHPGDSGSGLGPLGQPGDSGSGLGTLRRAGDSGSGAPFKAQPAALLWPAFAAAAAACLYSQYIGALALAFQGLFVLGWRRKALTPFLAAAGSAVVVFLPWLALAKSSLLGWPSTDAFHAGPGLFADAAFRY